MKRVDEMPKGAGPNTKYDWDALFDGSVWELTPEDFPGATVVSFRAIARNVARERNGKAVTRLRDGRVYLQFRSGKDPA